MKLNLILIFIGFLILLQNAKAQHCNPRDSLALVQLYNATDGPHWKNHTNWLKGPVNTWFGFADYVGNAQLFYVSALNLQNNNLTGTVPQELLQNLKFLSQLLLNGNNLNGNIPAVHDMPYLRTFYLDNNKFTGNVPEFANCPALQIIDLGSNQLTKGIPANIANLTNLTKLYLGNNQLSGKIPDIWANLKSMKYLDLGRNQFSGSIPASLGSLVDLVDLYLNQNKLSGAVPASMTNFKSRSLLLELSGNNLTFSGLEKLANLYKSFLNYSPQDTLTINKKDSILSIFAGGTLKNNTYHWTSDRNEQKIADSTYKLTRSGVYKVSVTNSEVPSLTLNSFPITVLVPPKVTLVRPPAEMILNGGYLVKDVSKINLSSIIRGVATDGLSKILIVAKSDIPVKFNINSGDGTIEQLGGGKAFSYLQPVNGLVVGMYTPPDGYGANSTANRVIQVSATDSFGANSIVNIQLITPPVLLIHGMWSGPAVWQEGGFQKYLNDHGLSNNYLVDYKSANAETFDPTDPLSQTARDAIYQKIDLAIHDAAAKGILVSQVDVVGHSLGGLQARGFMQDTRFLNLTRNYNKGYFHKVISIGTPHLGSAFGPILYQSENAIVKLRTQGVMLKNLVGYFKDMKVGSAHRDFDPAFQKSNTGLNRLAATVAYKAHAIEARYDAPGKPVKPAWASYISLLNASLGKNFNQDLNQILKDTTSDLIVPRYSQLGGLTNGNYYDHYNFTTHSYLGIETDFTETTHPVIQQRVAELLLTDNQAVFLNSGFPAPKAQKVPFEIKPLAVSGAEFSSATSTTDFRTESAVTNTDFLKITSPLPTAGLKNDGTDSLLLSVSFADPSQIANSVFVIPGLGFVGLPQKEPYITKVRLPNSLNSGRLQLLCLANDRNGNIYADTVSISINGADTLKSVSVDNADIRLDSLVRTSQITVNGLFVNKKTSISRDISLAQTGTTYTTLSKPAVVNVSPGGLITVLKTGKDTILVRNGRLSTKVVVTVDPNIFLSKKFTNTISFSISNKLTTDPPFALNGTVTSGDAINYSVISGPLKLLDGIATITGAGLVKVMAASSGNAYFSAAPNDTVSFFIQRVSQTITLAPFAPVVAGDADILPSGTASSGLTLSYSSGNIAVASVINNKIHIIGAGTTLITANQTGDASYSPASAVSQTLTVIAVPVITANGPLVFFSGGKVVLSASSGSTLNYAWTKDGVDISGASKASYTATTSGSYVVNVILGSRRIASAPVTVKSVFGLPANNFKISQTSVTCKGSNNGALTLAAMQTLDYTATISGPAVQNIAYPFRSSTTISNLAAGTYNVCITVAGQAGYQQCFTANVSEPKDLALYTTVLKSTEQLALSLNGGDTYDINLNGFHTITSSNQLTLPLQNGVNTLSVNTDKPCQGTLTRTIVIADKLVPFPNPFESTINLNLGSVTVKTANVLIYDAYNKIVYRNTFQNQSGVIQLSTTNLNFGIYFLRISVDGKESVYKMIKK